jgi:hypothetical protein
MKILNLYACLGGNRFILRFASIVPYRYPILTQKYSIKGGVKLLVSCYFATSLALRTKKTAANFRLKPPI